MAAPKSVGFDLGEDVARLHLAVEVDEDLGDPPRDLRADLNLCEGLNLPGGLDGLDDVALAELARDVFRRRLGGRLGAPDAYQADEGGDGEDDGQPAQPFAAVHAAELPLQLALLSLAVQAGGRGLSFRGSRGVRGRRVQGGSRLGHAGGCS
ncbi:MAG: hypothetical protein QM820_16360 [Minicystis sp.]